jgi:hypothetical protein
MSKGAKKRKVQREEKALATATEVIKLTMTLATGSLVFSAGILKEALSISDGGKMCLVVAWVSLGTSVICGALAYSRVPIMIAKGKQDLEDIYFIIPGRLHQIAFLIGVIALGLAMLSTLAQKGA